MGYDVYVNINIYQVTDLEAFVKDPVKGREYDSVFIPRALLDEPLHGNTMSLFVGGYECDWDDADITDLEEISLRYPEFCFEVECEGEDDYEWEVLVWCGKSDTIEAEKETHWPEHRPPEDWDKPVEEKPAIDRDALEERFWDQITDLSDMYNWGKRALRLLTDEQLLGLVGEED